MNTSNIARSLVGGIMKSSDIVLKNHALGLFYAELKHSDSEINSETPTANANAKADKVEKNVANTGNLDSATTSEVSEPAPVTIPVAEQIADVGEENASTSTEVTGSPATEDLAAAVNGTSETQYRSLSNYEVIQAGDEWILSSEFRHNRGGERRWRAVGDSIGRCPINYPKSNFRRKV